MIKNISTLILNDLAIAFKNKTFFLIAFIPLFVFLSLKLIDQGAGFQEIKVGIIKNEKYDPQILKNIKSGSKLFKFIDVPNIYQGRQWIKDKKIDGMIINSKDNPNRMDLVVLKKESLISVSMVEGFLQLQKSIEGRSPGWISKVVPLQNSGIQAQSLPTWILMLVLLVSFIIMPAQIAEEKEKKLLLALLQTPMREVEWIIAKMVSGMLMVFITIFLLHLLGKFEPGNLKSYIILIVAGSFCFCNYGILLGFLCRSQASARTLGVIFYLPHLLPSALSDFSKKLTDIAPLLISYQFYEPIKSILMESAKISSYYLELSYLLLAGTFTFLMSYYLLKKRWLMQ